MAEPAPTLVASETDRGWELALYLAEPPSSALAAAFAALAPSAQQAPQLETLADADWVALSRAGLGPVSIGRFYVHSEAGQPAPAGQWPIRIDAGLAFGTGRHATTAGCLAAASRLARLRPALNILDVGTGSGLLAIAARHLFPSARLTAADVDSVALGVARDNARQNHLPEGRRPGMLATCVASGVGHRLILGRAPYDLVFANILAGPLVALAPALAAVVGRGGHLILAGLLWSQRQQVLAAYRGRGFRQLWPLAAAEWPVLVLRNERASSRGSARRAALHTPHCRPAHAGAGRGRMADSL